MKSAGWVAVAWFCGIGAVALAAQVARVTDGAPLPGSGALTWQDDIASRLVDGVDRFLLDEIARSERQRGRHWRRDSSSAGAYDKSIEPNRTSLAKIIGARDMRAPAGAPQLLATTTRPSLVARGQGYEVHAIRWRAFGDVHGEGLLLTPTGRPHVASVIAIPDADQTPEQIAGIQSRLEPASQYPRRLAESGCRVIVPALIDRRVEARNGRARLSSREYLYRPAFELGRHILGYEVQKVLALVDWLGAEGQPREKIGVFGWGEGGLIALYAAALDSRIDAACVSGCFADRRHMWREPIDRNIFGLLDQFGDAEIASMVAPRKLVVEAARAPELSLGGQGGAPGRLVTPTLEEVNREVDRARSLLATLRGAAVDLVVSGDGTGRFGTDEALRALLQALGGELAAPGASPKLQYPVDSEPRQRRMIHEIDRHNQLLLAQSADVRKAFMSRLDTASPEKYEKSSAEYREIFYRDVIGRFDQPLLPAKPRTRLAYQADKWLGYEVVLDVWDNVIAYGILLLPRDLKGDQKRPVVVCQHGLEGRPQDIIAGDHPAYHDFAARLADRGFIVFAPQNLYIFGDRFRTLQRKANPLGKTLFSIITPQHQQILNWLKTLPNVDGKRIGFYGLSYGGKTAMRVPAILTDYCLSICSADFNEWVWKNASTSSPYSYVWTGEYEIFEFNLGSTFNYAEMAALIAPRPFMVERGHADGVAPDEMVAYEFARVRFLYEARLKLADRCEIEFFTGPHTINGKGTFEFLHRHLNWAR